MTNSFLKQRVVGKALKSARFLGFPVLRVIKEPFYIMKITNFGKSEIALRLEEFARKLNQAAQQVVIQDPQAFAEHIRKKGAELFSILKTTLFPQRARLSRPEYYRSRIKKRVTESLEDALQDAEVIEQITDSLLQAAKEDPYYRRLLGLEESYS